MTKLEIRALQILLDHGPVRPRAFARHLWGRDHEGWDRVGKCGAQGSTTGTGLVLSAGGYLGRLRQKGWTMRVGEYLEKHIITLSGRAALREHLSKSDL